MQGDDRTVSVVATQLSDCMTLRPEHIQSTDDLTLHIDLRLILSNNEAAISDSELKWEQTIDHLLGIIQPASISILVPDDGSRPLRTLSKEMEDGKVYVGAWNDQESTFMISR